MNDGCLRIVMYILHFFQKLVSIYMGLLYLDNIVQGLMVSSLD